MRADQRELFRDIMDRRDTIFQIPVYQRNYAWTEKECIELVEDIFKICNGTYNRHFIGMIVRKQDDKLGSDFWNVIDGQQRLTTMFLLAKALYDITEDEYVKKQLDDVLFSRRENEVKVRLKPIKTDEIVLKEIMNGTIEDIVSKDSRIYQNYMYFKDTFTKCDYSIEKVLDAIKRLDIIDMELQYDDDPQIIFESINSTGLSLTTADLIRNFLLMKENYDTQEKYYEKYWSKYETLLGVDNIPLFFETFLYAKTNKKFTRATIYDAFKSYYKEEGYNENTEQLFINLHEFIKIYAFMKDENSKYIECDEIRDAQNQLIELNITMADRVILQVYEYYIKDKITKEEIKESLNIFISYFLRRSVVGAPSSGLASSFNYLFESLLKYHEKYDFITSLKLALVYDKANTGVAFPKDEEFKNEFLIKNVYERYRDIKYILLSLENQNNKTKFSQEDFSIEHIMPQTLTLDWENKLGENHEEIHEKYLHTIGNLTITSYNSNLSNKSFKDKKEQLNEELHIKLNQSVIKANDWNEDVITKRAEQLFNQALQIWEYPQIDPQIIQEVKENMYIIENVETVILEDKKEKPIAVILPNKEEYKIQSRKGGRLHIISYIINQDQEKFIDMFYNTKHNQALTVKQKEEYKKIILEHESSDDKYLEIPSTKYKIRYNARNNILEEFQKILNIDLTKFHYKYSNTSDKEYEFPTLSSKAQELYENIISLISNDYEIKVRKGYIAIKDKTDKNYISLIFGQDKIKIYSNNIKDYTNWIDVTDVSHWGTGDYLCEVHSKKDIEEMIKSLK